MNTFYQIKTLTFSLKLNLKKPTKLYLVYHEHRKGSSNSFVQTSTKKLSRINYSSCSKTPEMTFILKNA